MVDRKAHDTEGRGRKAPPSGRHSSRSGPSDPAGSDVRAIDAELVSDLGAEYELRGDQLESELEAARNEAAEWQDKALRAQADFANTRRRLEAAHADALLRAGERIVQNLLPVLDDLDRAIDHASADAADVAEGLDGVRRKLLDILGREGCSVIEPHGEPFDPAKHNAVQVQEDADVTDHTVVEVYQKGYEMHGRVLRPAMVVVSTGGPSRE